MLPSERFNGDSSQDGRWGPRTVPRNKLSRAEREQIVAMAARSDFAIRVRIRLSLVLRRGECLASESSVYRILKTHDLSAHRDRARPSHRTRPRAYEVPAPRTLFSRDITYCRVRFGGKFLCVFIAGCVSLARPSALKSMSRSPTNIPRGKSTRSATEGVEKYRCPCIRISKGS